MTRFATLCVVLTCATLADAADWPQWLGPDANASSTELPAHMPAKKIIWRRPLMGKCHAGLAVAGGRLIVPDFGNQKDFFRCYEVETGKPLWDHSYPNAAEIEYTSAPRATPLIADGLVYTLGAAGDLHCLSLDSGEIVWQMNFPRRFEAHIPEYGYSSAPVIAGGKLIVKPGGPGASIAALDPKTGSEVWKTPGAQAAYAGFLVGTFGGVEQVVTYDVESLGGWELASGKRLWKITPKNAGDYNVCTPVDTGGKVLVSSENNGTILYGFEQGGKIIPQPLATNDDLALDMATPAIAGPYAFGTHSGLICIGLENGLETLWIDDEHESTWRFSNIITGNGRLLFVTEDGKMFLAAPTAQGANILGSMDLCKDTWSHPAIADGRLYIRDDRYLYCYKIGEP